MSGGLRALWRRLRADRRRRSVEGATRVTLYALDDRVLRDLGLDRSEIPSVAAAAASDLACRAFALSCRG